MPIKPNTCIEISKEDIKFSAAHFTIFSATERERLHGHNFKVSLCLTAEVGENGMCFSYVEIKRRLRTLVDTLDEYTLLPQLSPYLEIAQEGDQYRVNFNGRSLFFPVEDTQLLPLRNTTVEEFARYLLERLLGDDFFSADKGITELVVKVSSGPGQCGSACWTREA
ncbi:6-carboxytetrahydropterin synthase [Spongiibacter sp. KMU-158]|uniref:6-carboxy-5,6,7,8-tetrahydropterin synthase n=1 Tax=Spongiibacter pelagi TaxID=2760804 RepID=A0A927C0X9_9GAMM|nr:6-carboxytetrahydropterin synthase [Spongiibacter pelagi]MBD2858007.1 6-carboxytetrahydropterin synthase [Spongiibacter pelagi]